MTLVLRSTRRAGEVLLLVLTSVVLGAEIIRQPSMIRLAAAGCLGVCAIVAATQWPRTAAVTTLALLPYLAFGRRLLLEFTPWKSTDPLLLVAPAVAFVILVRVVAIERRPLGSDRISKLMLFLIVLSFLEAFNPRGGSLSAGLAALLFTVVPLVWFFVGREVGTRRAVEILLVSLVVSACLVAAYGLDSDVGRAPRVGQALAQPVELHGAQREWHDTGVRHVLERSRVCDVSRRRDRRRPRLRTRPAAVPAPGRSVAGNRAFL